MSSFLLFYLVALGFELRAWNFEGSQSFYRLGHTSSPTMASLFAKCGGYFSFHSLSHHDAPLPGSELSQEPPSPIFKLPLASSALGLLFLSPARSHLHRFSSFLLPAQPWVFSFYLHPFFLGDLI
jgi:hypothetical protein